MKLNTVIKFSDGREGTICWHNLDGDGGVWGRHVFEMPEGGFGDELPLPEFMLRKKSVEALLIANWHRHDLECVGDLDYEIMSIP